MCSVKNPSCLGSTKAQDVKKFSFDNVEEELQSRAPLLSAVLWAASMRKSKRRPFLEAKCVHAAAATPLKNRSPCMTLLQLLPLRTIMINLIFNLFFCHCKMFFYLTNTNVILVFSLYKQGNRSFLFTLRILFCMSLVIIL